MANENSVAAVEAALKALPVTGKSKAGRDKHTGNIGRYWVMAVFTDGQDSRKQKQVEKLRKQAEALGLTIS